MRTISTLVFPELAPLTFSVGFLDQPFSSVRDAFIEWKRRAFKAIGSRDVSSSVNEALLQLDPLTPIPRRWLLTSTASDWVALFDNCSRGPDPSPAVCFLSQQLRCRGVVATSIPHTLSKEVGNDTGLYGAVQFELFASHPTSFLNCERASSVAYEGGKWGFAESGSVQQFEQPENYCNRHVIDRFTSDSLVRYCHALGIVVDSPSYYRSPSVLISAHEPCQAVSVPIAEAQARMKLGSFSH